MKSRTTFSKVVPRAAGAEIGRSTSRMVQSVARSQPLEGKLLEQRLHKNLQDIKNNRLLSRHSHSPLLHFAQTCLNLLALFVVLIGFPACVSLLLSRSWIVRLFATFALVYIKILSFLAHHELVHGTVFRSRKVNIFFGRLVDVVNGGQYWTIEELQRQHIEHHADKVDYVSFDSAAFLSWLPRPLEITIVILEWCFIPAMAYISRLRSVFACFWHPRRLHARTRTVCVLLFRMSGYAAMAWKDSRALALYFISHNMFVNAYRLLDCFSHTFEELPVGADAPKGLTAAYEQNRTISLMVTSGRRSWLNAFFLNFGYHGAHHVDPTGPWLAYPELDGRIFEGCAGNMPRHVSPLRLFNRFVAERISRLYSTGGMGVPLVDEKRDLMVGGLWGVLDPSILMLEVAPTIEVLKRDH